MLTNQQVIMTAETGRSVTEIDSAAGRQERPHIGGVGILHMSRCLPHGDSSMEVLRILVMVESWLCDFIGGAVP